MIIFDSKQTEDYYYENLKRLGISHVNLSSGNIYTMEEIDEILTELEEIMNKYKK